MSVSNSILKASLIGFGSLAIAMGVGRFAYTPLLPFMLNEELISISEGGFIAAIHFLGYWIGALIAPRVPFTPVVSLRISLITIALCTLGMGLTENFLLWLIYRWLCGVCSAFTLVLVSNYYIKILIQSGHRYQQGLVFSGVGAGITLVGLASLVLMLTQTGSLQAWQVTGYATIAVVLLICLLIGNNKSQQQKSSSHRQESRGPLLWRIILPYGVAGFGYIIPATYLPVMARDFIPSAAVFGWAWPIFGTAAFLSTLLAVRIQSRYSNRQIWVVSQIIMSIGLLFPVLIPNIYSIIVAGICVGGTFMIITMAGMKEVHRVAAESSAMFQISAMTAAFATGQIIGPVFASFVFDLTQSFANALVIASLILVVSLLTLKETQSDYSP